MKYEVTVQCLSEMLMLVEADSEDEAEDNALLEEHLDSRILQEDNLQVVGVKKVHGRIKKLG